MSPVYLWSLLMEITTENQGTELEKPHTANRKVRAGTVVLLWCCPPSESQL